LLIFVLLIKDIYEGVRIRVRPIVRNTNDTNDFPIDIGLHQGSALSPFIFTLIG